MLEIEPAGKRVRTVGPPEVAATKTSLAPLQKHSLGGCMIVTCLSNSHRRGHVASPRKTLFAVLKRCLAKSRFHTHTHTHTHIHIAERVLYLDH